ncbi:MAG: D-beta-D-heptose 7-phosphate kinase/D-beta-D-heptose 1-phosphate adenosyltransferase [Bacteroidia bacterium]|jgi:D-beta-D-heptose 7-phosphate kinase/D-beta-D-heptose 1-phosphate adenosyltransferase
MKNTELSAILSNLGHPRVLIVGDLILDRYISGNVNRISPEAPIPVLAANHEDLRLGGAGNVCANLRAMEAQVEVLSVVGEDKHGRRLIQMLQEIGVGTDGILREEDRMTTEKTRLVSGVNQMLRVDWEETRALEEASFDELLRQLPGSIEGADAVILSDYGKGLLCERVIRAVIAAAKERGVPVLVDPKGNDFSRYRGATLVTPNRKEAEEAVGRPLTQLDDLPVAADELIAAAGLASIVITLGPEGIFWRTKDGDENRTPTEAKKVFDVVGAGDTVIAHLALGLGDGLSLGQAVELANHAAGIVVGRAGAASVTRSELFAAIGRRRVDRGKVLEADGDLDAQLAEWRSEGRRIVFTNGCFDVIHAGHVQYLRFSRSQGDVLIVGVNSDASVRRLKGETRPVNNIGDRLLVLAALEMVDAVVDFEENTPAKIIERVTPDVLVKGEDWRDKGVVGSEWVEKHGGRVVLAPLLEGRSTTSILERAKK